MENETNKRAIRELKTTTFGINKSVDPGKSKKIEDEPFAQLIHEGKVIAPPFDMLTLAKLNEENTELGPCWEAMEVNIVGFGYRFVSRIKPSKKKTPVRVTKEKVKLENFFSYCTQESYTDFRRKQRKDLEATGNSYYEVIRDNKGDVQSFSHIPSYQCLLGNLDEDPIKYERPILELQVDGSVKLKTITEWKRFRKYAQSRSFRTSAHVQVSTGYKTVWFKEFGDPRIMNCDTGEFADETLENEKQANEIVHRRIYSPRTPYGLPRIIGMLLSIYGARAAEEINFITFKNNNIPSMIIAVSNGQLNEASVQRIQDYIESIKESNDYSKFLLLEAEGFIEGEDGSQMKIDVKPMTGNQHKDALFQNYSDKAKDNVRRAFRLPPIFIGNTDDYARATVESSRVLADEQLFAPERNSEDEFMNRVMFPYMGIIYHSFKTNTPNTTDNQQLVKILAGAEKTGGMTPRIARTLLEDILGTELPPFPDSFDPDVPFSMTMAEAVKNLADPTEPGQQVTALKSLRGNSKDDDIFINYLLKARNELEASWSDDMEEECDC